MRYLHDAGERVLVVGMGNTGAVEEVIGTGEREGLYFVGYDVRQPGVLRTIGRQSGQVAEAIVRRLDGSAAGKGSGEGFP